MAKNRKYFNPLPDEPKRDNPPSKGMSCLSTNLFKTANQLLSMANKEVEKRGKAHDDFNTSEYCISAIILYCTTFEAFMNETLEFSRFLISKKDNYDKDKLYSTIHSIIDKQKIADKLYYFFNFYNQTPKELDFNNINQIKQLSALFNLRNELVHYKGGFTEGCEWPQRVKDAYKYIKVNDSKSNSYIYSLQLMDWLSYFWRIESAQWAKEVIINAVDYFCLIGNCAYHKEKYGMFGHFFNKKNDADDIIHITGYNDENNGMIMGPSISRTPCNPNPTTSEQILES